MAECDLDLSQLAYRYVGERLRRGEIAEATTKSIRTTLRGLIASAGDGPPSRLTRRRIERYLEREGPMPSTKRLNLTIIRRWCRWLVAEGYLAKDPTLHIDRIRQPRYLPRGLEAGAVAGIVAQCRDARMEVMVSLMVQEGLRCGEVSRLELGDIDFENELILVRGKGGHQRVLPLSDETRFVMLRYLDEEPARHGPFFRSRVNPTRGISAEYVSDLVGDAMKAAGVKETAHSLRHTAATDMLRAGAHVRDVQAALGHRELSTTQRYLPWLVGDLREAMGGRRYRAER